MRTLMNCLCLPKKKKKERKQERKGEKKCLINIYHRSEGPETHQQPTMCYIKRLNFGAFPADESLEAL